MMIGNNEGDNNLNRRTVLKQLGVSSLAGVGSAGLVSASLNGSDSDDTIEIVTAYSDGEPLLTKKVPRTWWQHVQSAQEVTERVKQQYLYNDSVSGVQAVGRVASEQIINGRRGRAVEIRVWSGFDAEVPDRINNIPIRVTEAIDHELFQCPSNQGCDSDNFNPVPGGVTVESAVGGGTSTCEVEMNGVLYLLTASHIFNGGPCSSDQTTYDYAYQNGDYFGSVEFFDENRDTALIELDSQNGERSGFDNYIEDTYVDQGGHISQSGLEDRMGTSTDDMTMMGVASCETNGDVSAVDIDLGVDCDGDGNIDFIYRDFVEYDQVAQQGDSGGPIFDTYESGSCQFTLIGSLVTMGDGNDCHPIQGPGAYALNNQHGISFSPETIESC